MHLTLMSLPRRSNPDPRPKIFLLRLFLRDGGGVSMRFSLLYSVFKPGNGSKELYYLTTSKTVQIQNH